MRHCVDGSKLVVVRTKVDAACSGNTGSALPGNSFGSSGIQGFISLLGTLFARCSNWSVYLFFLGDIQFVRSSGRSISCRVNPRMNSPHVFMRTDTVVSLEHGFLHVCTHLFVPSWVNLQFRARLMETRMQFCHHLC